MTAAGRLLDRVIVEPLTAVTCTPVIGTVTDRVPPMEIVPPVTLLESVA